MAEKTADQLLTQGVLWDIIGENMGHIHVVLNCESLKFHSVSEEFCQSFERYIFIMQGLEAVNSLGPAQHGFSPYTFNGG